MNTPFNNAYITASGSYLPGKPVSNDQIEEILGMVHGKPSRLRKRILKSNGIKFRHYALDKNQNSTHQNSDLANFAARDCLDRSEVDLTDLDMLAVASTQGDLPLPGIASCVQAKLGVGPLEILSTHGVCASSMMALKGAVSQVRLGEKRNALVIGTELASRLLKKSRYEAAYSEQPEFESEFLRWMLSDGAGALMINDQPRWNGLSLKVDWIELVSFASDYDLCMSCGTADQSLWSLESSSLTTDFGETYVNSDANSNAKSKTATLVREKTAVTEYSWQDYNTYADAEKAGALLIRQNLRLLEEIVKVGVSGLVKLINNGKIAVSDIDHFVCHYSSHHFKGRILELLNLAGATIPEEKWFTNLYNKGNTGCASIFIALDELLRSNKLEPGQTVFCAVPESGRFTAAYMKLTVVEGRNQSR